MNKDLGEVGEGAVSLPETKTSHTSMMEMPSRTKYFFLTEMAKVFLPGSSSFGFLSFITYPSCGIFFFFCKNSKLELSCKSVKKGIIAFSEKWIIQHEVYNMRENGMYRLRAFSWDQTHQQEKCG